MNNFKVSNRPFGRSTKDDDEPDLSEGDIDGPEDEPGIHILIKYKIQTNLFAFCKMMNHYRHYHHPMNEMIIKHLFCQFVLQIIY
jgi:hypothetical protein